MNWKREGRGWKRGIWEDEGLGEGSGEHKREGGNGRRRVREGW